MNFKVVVVAHGSLGEQMVASARLIGGALAGVQAVGLAAGERSTDLAERLTALLDDTPTLLLTDLRGGTPDNVARVLARRRGGIAVVSNANLPILLEAVLGETDFTAESITDLCTFGIASCDVDHLEPKEE